MVYYTLWREVGRRVEPVAAPPVEPSPAAVRLEGCWKAFGGGVALQPTSLRLGGGTVTLVTGANGAGKSTLLRVIAGSLGPSGGRRVAGGRGLYLAAGDGGRRAETVAQAVGFAANAGGGEAGGALALADCAGLADRRVAELSGGQRARLTLAVAAAAKPAVVCVDEPLAHLDDAGQATLCRVVAAVRDGGCAVVLATPTDPGEDALNAIVDRVVAVRAGRAAVVR